LPQARRKLCPLYPWLLSRSRKDWPTQGGDGNAKIRSSAEPAPRGAALARKRLVIALVLSAAMMAIYFGFMGLFAFDKPLLGTILAPGLSLCIVLGPLVIISSFLLCLVYVLWANRVFDAGIRELTPREER
jgi:uncharacterized membrane protein (DUF485 family)